MSFDISLLSLLLPEEVSNKLTILDDTLTPEEQFEAFGEMIQAETGIEVKFDKNLSLRENLQPLLKQMSIKDRTICYKLLEFVEDKIAKNKELLKKGNTLDFKEGDTNGAQSKSINTTNAPDFIFFK